MKSFIRRSSISTKPLFNIATQVFFGKNYSQRSLPPELSREFDRRLLPVAEEFQEHKVMQHPLFDYLKERSQYGFNKEQFEIYRANFFRRTELTIASIARVIELAVLNNDMQTATETIQNLNDEAGHGNPDKMHGQLLLKSHNWHGMRVFGLDPIPSLSSVATSPLLVPEVEKFRDAKRSAFENKPYPHTIGNMWAHEFAADKMLIDFKETFFDIYKAYYSSEEYKDMMEFFMAHNDESVEGGDVEAQHERMARAAAQRACNEVLANIDEIRAGGLDFLDHQSSLWDGMLRELEKAESKSPPTPLTPEKQFPKSLVKNPSISTTQKPREL